LDSLPNMEIPSLTGQHAVQEIVCADQQQLEAAHSLAERLQLTVLSAEEDAQQTYCLRLADNGLSLIRPHDKKMGDLYVDFCEGAVAWRRHHGGGNGQAIAKAIGLKTKKNLTVLDATAGTGTDSFILAALGCHVTMIERHPIVAALLEDALKRAQQHEDTQEVAARMSLLTGSSIDLMAGALAASDSLFDVVYLDPMFPKAEKSKGPQVKKSMQFFRDMVGKDEDADALLAPAMNLASYRVVVKRPRKSPFLNDQKPTLSHEGKANRFDIYVKQSMK